MAQDVLVDKSLDVNLTYIKSNFEFLLETIKCLEKSSLSLNDAITLIDAFQKCNGQKGKSVNQKCNRVLPKNEDYDTHTKILKIFNDESESIQTK